MSILRVQRGGGTRPHKFLNLKSSTRGGVVKGYEEVQMG